MTLPLSLLQHVEPLALIIARMGGLFVFAPVLSSAVIPTKIKALLVFMFALAAYPLVGVAGEMQAAPDLASLGVSLAIEATIGVSIGLLAAMPIYAAQLSGLIIDHQIGLGLGSVYNPLFDTEGTTVGELLMYIALATFLMIGGLDALYFGIIQTYTYLPMGHAEAMVSPLGAIVGLVGAGLELALRVAAPVLCVILLETVASAFLMKTMPQMNVMSVGFALKIMLGFFVLTMSLRATNSAIAGAVEDGMNVVFRWIHAH